MYEEALLRQMPFVSRMARHMRKRLPPSVDVNDLVSAGTLGLMEAMARFDPERKVEFDQYARSRIRGAMVDSLRALDWSPRPLRRKGRALDETVRALTARLKRTPDEFEIAAEMKLSLAEYQELIGELHGLEVDTLHVARHEGASEEAIDFLPGSPEDDSLLACLRGEVTAQLTAAIESLPERERMVITLYYYEEMNLREIAMLLGVCQSRASQIHATAVSHLRASLEGREPRRKRNGDRRAAPRHCRSTRAAA